MKAAVVLFPGSNREGDALRALRVAGAKPTLVWFHEQDLPAGTDLVVLPGGFSFGDYLRCGAIAGRSPIMGAVQAHCARGGYCLGICNGFQILVESQLLPGALLRNSHLRFVCRMQHIRVERNDTAFAGGYRQGQAIEVAIAHGEGNYTADDETLRQLEAENRVAFRYCDAGGDVPPGPGPNGSRHAIAGVYSHNLRVLGMMPHPENLIDDLCGGTDGLPLFRSLVASGSGTTARQ